MTGRSLTIAAGLGALVAFGGPYALPKLLSPDEEALAPAPSEAEPAALLTFTTHTGEAVSEADFHGRYLLVFFGYSHCPDVCPTDLQIMSEALDHLGDAADGIQPLFITIDPERDTPDVLADYVAHFHPRLIGLTGTEREIAAALQAYDVVYVEREPGSLSHTADSYLIGPDGDGVAVFEHGSDASQMAAEIVHLVDAQGDP